MGFLNNAWGAVKSGCSKVTEVVTRNGKDAIWWAALYTGVGYGISNALKYAYPVVEPYLDGLSLLNVAAVIGIAAMGTSLVISSNRSVGSKAPVNTLSPNSEESDLLYLAPPPPSTLMTVFLKEDGGYFFNILTQLSEQQACEQPSADEASINCSTYLKSLIKAMSFANGILKTPSTYAANIRLLTSFFGANPVGKFAAIGLSTLMGPAYVWGTTAPCVKNINTSKHTNGYIKTPLAALGAITYAITSMAITVFPLLPDYEDDGSFASSEIYKGFFYIYATAVVLTTAVTAIPFYYNFLNLEKPTTKKDVAPLVNGVVGSALISWASYNSLVQIGEDAGLTSSLCKTTNYALSIGSYFGNLSRFLPSQSANQENTTTSTQHQRTGSRWEESSDSTKSMDYGTLDDTSIQNGDGESQSSRFCCC